MIDYIFLIFSVFYFSINGWNWITGINKDILTKTQINKCKKNLKNKARECRKTNDYLTCMEAGEINSLLKNLNNPNSHDIHLIKNVLEENSGTNSILERLNKNFTNPWKR